MKRLPILLLLLVLVSCTIAPPVPKPRVVQLIDGNTPIVLHSQGPGMPFQGGQGFVDRLNALYDDYGYELNPPRKAGYGVSVDPIPANGNPNRGYLITVEARQNFIEMEKFRDRGDAKQGTWSKITEHL